MIRLGMTNPPYILEQLREVTEAMEHRNFFAFTHVPVQSGSNFVLSKSRMNREYTVEDFEKVVNGLKEKVPSLEVMTDIICGFPGETRDHFEETLTLIKRCRLSQTNISQFYARPGTPAAKFRPRVPTQIVKERSRKLTTLLQTENFKNPYANLLDSVVRCYARDELADDGQRLVCHTKSYVKVLVPFDKALVGAHFDVKVTSTSRWHVDANVLSIILPADPSQRPALRAALKRLQQRNHQGSNKKANMQGTLPTRFRPTKKNPPRSLMRVVLLAFSRRDWTYLGCAAIAIAATATLRRR